MKTNTHICSEKYCYKPCAKGMHYCDEHATAKQHSKVTETASPVPSCVYKEAVKDEVSIREKICADIFQKDLEESSKETDLVNHPKHYTEHPSGIECITITEHMSFCLGNALKYIWRADLKGNALQDLEKAVWYLQREIALRSKGETNETSI